MKCETCFWVKVTKLTSATTSYVCQLEPLSMPTSPNGRCSHWRFSGKERCGNCRNHVDEHCLLNSPYCAGSTLVVSENDWCGQFKGKMI